MDLCVCVCVRACVCVCARAHVCVRQFHSSMPLQCDQSLEMACSFLWNVTGNLISVI